MSGGGDSKRSGPVAMVAAVVLLILLLGAAAYVVFLGVRDVPSVVGALVTALGAVLAVVAGRIYETKTAVEQARRERLAPLYERFVELFHTAGNSKVSEREMQKFFADLGSKIIVWGPPPIVRAFSQWRREVAVHQDSPESVLAFERLLTAVRSDLGIKAGDLKPGEVLGVIVNDIDDFIAAGELTDSARAEDQRRS